MSTPRTAPAPADAAAHDEDDARAAATVLAVSASALRHSLDRVRAADDAAWAEYSRSLDEAASQLQAELIVAGARLDAQRAERPDQVQEAMSSAGDALHEWLDTARVQAHLGRMDAEAELERRAAELREATRRAAATTSHTVEEARHGAAVVLTDILDLVRVTFAAARNDVPRPHPDDDPAAGDEGP